MEQARCRPPPRLPEGTRLDALRGWVAAAGNTKGGEKMKFKVCPWCGSHLDYGERCDCTDAATKKGGAQGAKADQAGKRKPRLLDQKAG